MPFALAGCSTSLHARRSCNARRPFKTNLGPYRSRATSRKALYDTHALPNLPLATVVSDPDPNLTVYIVLGLSLFSFGLTFGVAPQFRSAFKEEETWQEIYSDFVAMGGVESIEPEVAAMEAAKGSVLMDIRLARKFEQGSSPNSQNFPLYQPIQGWDLPSNIRRAGFAFFGIFGTERNVEWLEQVQAAVPTGTEIIVACDTGGTLETKPGADTGFQSQSLKAAYYLKKAGYQVKHMKGGLSEYQRSVGPLVPSAGVAQAEDAKEKAGTF